MQNIYAPAIRVFVVAGLFMATATLMIVTLNTARAAVSETATVQTPVR